MTAGATFVVGLAGYVSGQLISKFLIDPVHELRKAIGEIADLLIENLGTILAARSVGSPPTLGADLNAAGTDLRVKTFSLPLLEFFAAIHAVPAREKLADAAKRLIWLSKAFPQVGTTNEQIDNCLRAIEDDLGLPKLTD